MPLRSTPSPSALGLGLALTTLAAAAFPARAAHRSLAGPDILVAGCRDHQRPAATLWKNGRATPLTGPRMVRVLAMAVSGPDVYAAGTESNGQVNVAMVWKNGVPLPPLSDGRRNAEAEAVVVAGGAVLTAGFESAGAPALDSTGNPAAYLPVATLWRDGSPVRLSDGSRFAMAHALAVDGTTVYVAGEESRSGGMDDEAAFATVWRVDPSGPVPTRLTDGSAPASAAAICLAGPR